MPTSATGNSGQVCEAGFTLVEVMTTLFVVALLAGAVLLITPGPERKSRGAAEALAARILRAEDESVATNRTMALVVTDEGYGFAKLEETGWRRIDDASALAFRSWPEGVDARVEKSGADGGDETRIARFDPIVGVSPARVAVSGGGAWWTVEIDARGEVHVTRAR